MYNPELLQISNKLRDAVAQYIVSCEKDLTLINDQLREWKNLHDSKDEPMTMEEMKDNQELKNMEYAEEMIWNLEYFLGNLKEFKKAVSD